MKATVFPGKVVMVFDSKLWDANGGDSKTDSFFREATILKVYDNNPEEWTSRAIKQYHPRLMADVRFHHDLRISKGHFVNGMEECSLAVSR